MLRSRLASAVTPRGTLPPGSARHPSTGMDWSARRLRIAGASVNLAGLYLTDGVGLAGDNLFKLWELGRYLQSEGLPFIVNGDWNATPAALASSRWLRDMGAVIVLPPADATCTMGQGSVIDYMVVSIDALHHLADVRLMMEAYFRPHVTYRVTLAGTPPARQELRIV